MKLVSISDLVSRLKVTRYTVDQCVHSGILPVIKTDKHKRLFDKKRAEEVLKVVISLQNKNFPVNMIAKVIKRVKDESF